MDDIPDSHQGPMFQRQNGFGYAPQSIRNRVIVEVHESGSESELPSVPAFVPVPGELNLRINERFYDQIMSGRKSVEIRLNSANFNKVLPAGGLLILRCRDLPSLRVRVSHCEVFSNSFELLTSVGFKNYCPDAGTLEEAQAVFLSFPGYRALENRVGVVCYHLDSGAVSVDHESVGRAQGWVDPDAQARSGVTGIGDTDSACGETARPQKAMQVGTSSEEPPRKRPCRRDSADSE